MIWSRGTLVGATVHGSPRADLKVGPYVSAICETRAGPDAGMDYVFGTDDSGGYWWKVMARETDIGLTRWSEEVYSFRVSDAVVVESSWGTIKAGF
ncbi:MAG: hypothetical protein NTW26_11225 [bacterium]|nr:hypothetical protein [bacterium]